MWLVVGVLLALIVLFEVGIRHVPPDGMTVTYTCSACGDPYVGTRTYSAHADQQTVAGTYAALNGATVAPAWPGNGCAFKGRPPSSVVFVWHGIPVESWTLYGCWYFESAGGISDALFVQHLLPDITMPLPPPIEG